MVDRLLRFERPAWADRDLLWLGIVFLGALYVLWHFLDAHLQAAAVRAQKEPAPGQTDMAAERWWLIAGLAVWSLGLIASVASVVFTLEYRSQVLRWGLGTGIVAIVVGLHVGRRIRLTVFRAWQRRVRDEQKEGG